MDELTVPAADGVSVPVSYTGKGLEASSCPVALDACTTSRTRERTRELRPPVSGHGFQIRAALAALAGALATWRGCDGS